MTVAQTIPAADYHADTVADVPSLSSSIAHILCTRSPAHAWTAHPKLNPNYEPEERTTFDIGTVAHALLLQGDAGVEVIDAPDWRTKAAKEQRDEARAAGKVPLLAHQLATVVEMVDVARANTASFGPPMFENGQPEQTIVWEEQGVLCRARLDWLNTDYATIDDYKTTGKSASPEAWERALFNNGADIQAEFYLRALRAIDPSALTAQFRWLVQETSPPYALAIVTPGPDVLTLAHKKVDYALDVWKRCLEADSWPSYPAELHVARLPAYEEYRWLDKEEREAA